MGESKLTLQWVEQTLQSLSEQGYTGTVVIRLSQGGQGTTVNQKLLLRQYAMVVIARPLT